MNYNGETQEIQRRYDSLRNFIGENQIHPFGEVLCVSENNNDEYNIYLVGDGKSTFMELYNEYLHPSTKPLGPNSVGTEELKDRGVGLEDLSQEVLDEIAGDFATEGEVREIVTDYQYPD